MQEFSHVIADPAGLHARPVASIASEALKWRSAATVTRDADAVAASDLMGLMGLDARCGDTLVVRVEGPDEQEAAAALRRVFTF